MNHKIFDALYKQNDIRDVVFLSEITSSELKKSFEGKGYYAGFTADEWQKAYPRIPADKVCCFRSILFTHSLMYYDKNKYICMSLPVIPGMLSYEEERILSAIASMEKAYEEKDYMKLLMATFSEGSGNITMPLLESMLENEEPSPRLYKAFLSMYTMVDCGINAVNINAVQKKLKAAKSEEQWAETRKRASRLPDTVTIYRGMSKYSAPAKKALSWALSANVAYFFAGRHGAEGSKLLTATVKREDIFEVIDGNEQEVLVFPENVHLLSQENFTTFEEFLSILRHIPNIIEADKRGCAPDALSIIHMIEDLYETNATCKDHAATHSIRVTLLAICIFYMEECHGGVLIDDAKKTMHKAFWDMIYATSYHDAGRRNDMDDIGHGKRGYEIYKRDHGENPFVRYAIEMHDCDTVEKPKQMSKRERLIAGKILSYLKDADALDRWRFGGMSRDFVDVSKLRTKSAVLLMPVAAQLVESNVSSDAL